MNKKRQGLQIIVFSIILSLVAIGILIFGFKLVSSSKVVVLQSISNLYGKISDIEDRINFNEVDKIVTSKNVGVKGSVEYKDSLTNFKINYDLLENHKNNKSKLDLGALIGKEELIGGKLVLQDDKAHIFINDLTPNFYNTKFEYIRLIRGLKEKSYDQMVSYIKETVDEVISNKDITKEGTKIKYNGKDKKVNKLSYIIKGSNLKSFLDKLTNKIYNDKNLLKDICSLLDISEKEFKDSVNNKLKELEKNKNKEYFNYQVYYYGFNKIVMYELYDFSEKITIKYELGKKEEITLINEENKEIKLIIDKEKKTFDIIVNNLENKTTITGKYDSDLLEFKNDKSEIIFEKSKSNGFNKVIMTIKNDDLEIFNITFIFEFYYDKDVKEDLSLSKDINSLTEDDLILLEEMVKNSKFYKLYEQMDNIYNSQSYENILNNIG